MKLSRKVVVPKYVMARQVGEECVMLDLANGTYFGLDSVGARIWELLGEGKTLAEICDLMMDEYEVSRDDIERDVTSLVEQLIVNGLISPE